MNELSFWLSILTLAAAYLGFAAVLGELIHQAYRCGKHSLWWAAAIFAGLIFLPASLALPCARSFLWLAGACMIGAFSIRPGFISSVLQRESLLFRYFSVVMLLIFIWSVSSGQLFAVGLVGFPAVLAGLLVWRRSNQYAMRLN